MITPSYGITATERVLPKLALDFTTASLDPRVAIARAGNTATVVNSSGVIVGVNADLPRFDFDPVTLACRGLLVEEARTNALLNSLIDGTDLAAQSVTVTAAVRTLSFYGDGEIVLSGAASATVTGTGAYPARRTFTFTPSAGSLTLTVTGTVQFAQLEAGSSATSFIPTAGAAVTRNADVATMTGTNFSDWFNATEGTFALLASSSLPQANCHALVVNSTGTNFSNAYTMRLRSDGNANFTVRSGGADQAFLSSSGVTANVLQRFTAAYKVDDFATARAGGSVSKDTSGALPVSLTQLCFGSIFGLATTFINGHVAKLEYYPQRLTDAEVQSFSK